jgi:hypothetical protein
MLGIRLKLIWLKLRSACKTQGSFKTQMMMISNWNNSQTNTNAVMNSDTHSALTTQMAPVHISAKTPTKRKTS